MAVSAGDLDRRITIQVGVVTRDGAGDVITSFPGTDDFKLWAKKTDQRGFETVGSQELVRTADTVFEVRDRTKARTIHPETHRIEIDGKVFTIVSIQQGKTRKDTLQLLTSSRPDGRGARGPGNLNGV